MQKIKFGIIGAGVLAPLHARAITSNPRADLVAVSDIDYQKADTLAHEYNIEKIFTNYEEMLLEPIDVVSICVPSGLHADIAVKCAAKGKHILCEKPLDISLEKIDAMIYACKESNVKLGTVFQRRTLPHMIKAKKIFDEGALGNLMMLNATLKYYRDDAYYASAGWRGKWELDGGGALMNQGVHGIDLLQWIGGPIESVFSYHGTLARKNIEVEDTAVAILQFKNGGFGIIQCATSIFPTQDTTLEINGHKGTIKIADKSIHIWDFIDDNKNIISKPVLPPADHNGHSIIVDDMIDVIIHDRDPMIPGIEARKSVELILAIYESARQGKEIKLADFHPFDLKNKV